MNESFSCIGIIGHPHYSTMLATYKVLYHWLVEAGYQVIVEHRVARELNILEGIQTGTLSDIGCTANLAVVIGGDGSMLGAARDLARYNIKVIGINRGKLGFLTDLDPDHLKIQLSEVLAGNYLIDQRFLLEGIVLDQSGSPCSEIAMNEIVVHPGKVAHMIEFEVYIDDSFAFSERSDGLIISTPTGSTAYALSAGGPIITPSLDAISLVPMFPHRLSARPLVIKNSSNICLRFLDVCSHLKISFDSQVVLPVYKNDQILIHRSDYSLNLIHPKHYNYFHILSAKLGWSKKFFKDHRYD
ncbi:NAD(+) kinase [Candidatus Erwinia haradaeae]|uniref:NAD kinase n=1 Tax=Candidatus Erwinia haradaeae TaxID=1922217 RepID=A0A451DAA2_9GAMM|nr:NAD(+) kinase [Candidatus Erwinia haradaeae]VFP83236.1 NAD kinase [Candidatus Erwinia haradaeae]